MSKALKVIRNVIIIVELGLLIVISFSIYTRLNSKDKVLGAVAYAPLNRDDYTASPSGGLKYYYEPQANFRIVQERYPWFTKNVSYTINLDSLNERYDYEVDKPKSVYRIITLGDSFTFGSYVNTADNWTEILERELNELNCEGVQSFEVINLGMWGFGPEYIMERFRTRGTKYNSDLIIWNEAGSGFERVNELHQPIFEEIYERLTDKEKEEEISLGKYNAWARALDEVIRIYGKSRITEMIEKSWKEFYELRGDTDVLILSNEGVVSSQKTMLKEWAGDEENLEFYFGLPDTYKEGLHFLDGHPNEDGHKAIAESTLNYLKENYLTNCD